MNKYLIHFDSFDYTVENMWLSKLSQDMQYRTMCFRDIESLSILIGKKEIYSNTHHVNDDGAYELYPIFPFRCVIELSHISGLSKKQIYSYVVDKYSEYFI